jgi:hypothetical protein
VSPPEELTAEERTQMLTAAWRIRGLCYRVQDPSVRARIHDHAFKIEQEMQFLKPVVGCRSCAHYSAGFCRKHEASPPDTFIEKGCEDHDQLVVPF